VDLDKKIERRKARIGVIGLGYVGLPLAAEFAKAGFKVLGFDLVREKITAINKGDSYIPDIPTAELAPLVRDGFLQATDDFSRLKEMDALSICVPTPLRKTKDPDLSYIVASVDAVVRYAKKEQLIVLESTTYPGTTEELVLPALEEGGKKAGKDFFLAFSPERIDPGNRQFKTKNIPKIIGGVTPACTRLAVSLYSTIIEKVIPVSSSKVAEMIKLLENTFRAVNIGLVNEIAILCSKMNVNVWEVIEGAASKPFGFMPFYPGPGLGGHCLPIDPLYLSWKAKLLDFETRFIDLAAQVNGHMPHYVAEVVGKALNEHRKPVNGSKILLLGVAYKNDVNDVRESPAIDIWKLLEKEKAKLSYHDPYIPDIELGGSGVKSRPLTKNLLKEADCVVIVTNHRLFNFQEIVNESLLVVDTRNATKGLKIPAGKVFKI